MDGIAYVHTNNIYAGQVGDESFVYPDDSNPHVIFFKEAEAGILKLLLTEPLAGERVRMGKDVCWRSCSDHATSMFSTPWA
jgi:hypothetical protein